MKKLLILMLLLIPTVNALTLDINTQIQPNTSSSGYYNITNISEFANLTVNSTHVIFMNDTEIQVINFTSGLNITPLDTGIVEWRDV